MKILLIYLHVVFLFSTNSFAAPGPDYNAKIVEAVHSMPSGGGHKQTLEAALNLQKSMWIENGKLVIKPEISVPTFCSAATYLVFLSLLVDLQKNGLEISEPVLNLLLAHRQLDGQEIWGRWNANGPGVARLFFETGMGRNFVNWNEAKPGDFLKIFLNEFIGKKERGHLVVYLGTELVNGQEMVKLWSSNPPEGRSFQSMPRTKIVRWVFSRFEHPEAVQNIASIPFNDTYLASLLTVDSSEAEMWEKVGIRK